VAWTDERLDDLAGRMDAGFARVDAELLSLRGEMHDGFRELRGDVETLRSMMFRFLVIVTTSLVAVTVALAGAIAAAALG
jgi:hypothetical protein